MILSLASACGRGEKSFLTLDSGGHMAIIRSLTFSPDGRYLISAGEDKTIRVWDLSHGNTIRCIRGYSLPGNTGKIHSMALSPNGNLLAVGGMLDESRKNACAVRLNDLHTGRVIYMLKGHRDAIQSLAFSPDGHYLASASSDKKVRIWDIIKRKEINVFRGHKDSVLAVAFSSDGKRLVSGSMDKTLILWDVFSGSRIATMRGHKKGIFTAAFDPTNSYLASGSIDKTVRLWDARTGRFIKVLTDQGTRVASLTFSPDGKRLLTGVGKGVNEDCHVYSVPDGRELITFRKHDEIVMATAISPDGRFAATGGGQNHTILVWELKTGRVVKRLEGRGGTIWTVGFIRDGKSILWGHTLTHLNPLVSGPLNHRLYLGFDARKQLAMDSPVSDKANYVTAVDRHGRYVLKREKSGPNHRDTILKLFKNNQEIHDFRPLVN